MMLLSEIARREGENVGFAKFLLVGALVIPPALVFAIAARLPG
jgi:Na+/H+ antiporter NhaD/arsenite permease-like protein